MSKAVRVMLLGSPKAGGTAIFDGICTKSWCKKEDDLSPLTVAYFNITKNSRLQVWDMNRDIIYLNPAYYQGETKIVILVCDLSNELSIEKQLEKFISGAKQHAPVDVTYILVGNKTDLLSVESLLQREQELQTFADHHSISIVVTTTTRTDLTSIKKLENIMFAQIKQQSKLADQGLYQNIKEAHTRIFKQQSRVFLGFFRRTHMDFNVHKDMDSIRQYAAAHPKSRTAQALQEVEPEVSQSISGSKL